MFIKVRLRKCVIKYFSKKPIMLKYCLDTCMSALKFVPDWLVTSKMLEILDNIVFSNDDINLNYLDCDIVTFLSDDMDVNTIGLNNINLDDNDLEIMIHVRPVAWCNEYKQCKTFEKEFSKDVMLVAWHPTRWWDWCVPEDKEKQIELFLDSCL